MLDVDKLAEKALALEEKGSKGDATSEGDEADRQAGRSHGWIEEVRVDVPGAGLP